MGNFSSPRCRITHLGSRCFWSFHLFCGQKLVKGMKRLILFSMMCLVAIASTAQSISGHLRERWTGYYPVSAMAKDAYVYTQYIGASLTYNFNATNSKYKGTGAGNAEKNRL